MTYPVRTRSLSVPIPLTMGGLGPVPMHLFNVMHRTTAHRCIQAGALLSTKVLLADPGHKIIGVPSLVRSRLTTDMPHPWLGSVADAVPLSITPRTAAAFGSYKPAKDSAAERFSSSDLVIAVTTLDNLISSGLPLVFSGELPVRDNIGVTPNVDAGRIPWDRIRLVQFSRDVPFEERTRYNSEVLVWATVPLDIGVQFAVADQAAADALTAAAKALGAPLSHPPLIRPNWFFGRG